MKKSLIYTSITVISIIVFFLVRIITIIPNWMIFFESFESPYWNQVHLFHKIVCVGSTIPLDFLNLYWFSKIINIIMKLFKSVKTEKKTLDLPGQVQIEHIFCVSKLRLGSPRIHCFWFKLLLKIGYVQPLAGQV